MNLRESAKELCRSALIVALVTACSDGARPEVTRVVTEELRTPAPPGALIEDIVGAGNGCGRPGSMLPVISPDRTSFTLVLRDMQLAYPPNPPVQSKACKVIMHIHAPPGWQYGIATIDARGYMNLTSNVEARETARYTFGGRALGGEAHGTRVGPTDPLGEEFTFTDYVTVAPIEWSPCGSRHPFKMDVKIALDARAGGAGATGIVSLDSLDGAFEIVTGWQWRRCSR